MRLTRRILARFALAAGLGATAWLLWFLGLAPTIRALTMVGVVGVFLLTLAHGCTLTVLGAAWWALVREARGAGLVTFVWSRMVRDAAGELLPFSQVGGFALGARAAMVGGLPWTIAVASSLLDVFVEQATKTIYAAASVALLIRLAPTSSLIAPAVTVVALTAAATAWLVLRRRWAGAKLEAAAAALVRRWPEWAAGRPQETAADVREVLASGARRAAALHLTAWLMGTVEAWLAFRLLGARLDLAQAMIVDGLYVATRIFVFGVPAAVGVQEAAYVVLASLFQVPAPTALAFSLVRRARDLAIGVPALLSWQLVESGRLAPWFRLRRTGDTRWSTR